ncbi:MAG: T9SS type A sorting domain-containing protein [Saprospiraceae bacterium]|nr:T9SS type A sorting domain-containing protein [Saprospiraceae bacterium]
MRRAIVLLACFWVAILQLSAQIVVSGDITSDITWTKNNTYLLSGFVYVTGGAKLTIEPGTVIKGEKASKGALIVARGAQIIANGTPSEPIVFTSNESAPTYGDWGGLIILGYAPTNQLYNGTPGLGLIEGGLDPVKGLYGGGDQTGGAIADDNSGILRYVRIEYAGIAFQPNNEINGLTMGSVGSKTTIEYVQVSYANDDAFEWFGGTVNCKYLIAYRALDDDFDCDFGYAGKIQFALSVRDPLVADVSGSNGFEIDNNATGSGATPKTRPTFSNVTLLGPGANPAVDYKRANHLRRNSETGLYNSVFVGAYPVGLFIDGDSCAVNAQSGKMVIKNTFYHGMTTPLSSNASAGVGFDIAAYAAANQISTGTNSAAAGLLDPFNIDLPNPRPSATSPVLGYARFDSDARIKDAFFTPVSYAGAFGPSGDWSCPWAKWANSGCLPSNQEVIVAGDITSNTNWTADKTYILQGFVYVSNCATLTIAPGTVIKGDKGSKGALIVSRCSKIIADGTQDLPIVFTTNDPNPSYGSWGGLIILGYAPTNQTYSGTACLGLIEGGIDAVKGLYGSGDQPGGCGHADDNSGILRHVRVEYPGIAFQPNNEINGITFGGVGSGTTVDYVQVSYSGDDAFEWFGGTVNAKHLIAYRALDDDFDCDFGFSGNVQYALSVRDPLVADVSGSNGFEVDNNATGSATTPKTAPTFSNVTLLGPGSNPGPDYKRAAHLRRNSEIGLFNSLLMGSYPVGLFIDGTATIDNAKNGLLEVKNTWVAGPTALLNSTDASWDIAAWFNTAGNGNGTAAAASAVALQDPYDLDFPNAQPTGLSPAVAAGAAAFTAARVNKPFFDKVAFVGAFSGNDDWTCGWAKFLELNASCLVETKDVEQYISQVKLFPTLVNDHATLQVTLPQSADLTVELYNLEGQYFGQPVQEQAAAGEQTYTLSTANLPAGFYFVRIQAGPAVATEKMIVVR